MRLLWSPLALERVDEAFAYISADDTAAAGRWLEELLERVAGLRRFPDSGRLVPEFGRRDLRELLVGSYRVIYRRSENAVEVLTVRHQARALDAGELATWGGSNKLVNLMRASAPIHRDAVAHRLRARRSMEGL